MWMKKLIVGKLVLKRLDSDVVVVVGCGCGGGGFGFGFGFGGGCIVCFLCFDIDEKCAKDDSEQSILVGYISAKSLLVLALVVL